MLMTKSWPGKNTQETVFNETEARFSWSEEVKNVIFFLKTVLILKMIYIKKTNE